MEMKYLIYATPLIFAIISPLIELVEATT